MPKYSDMNDPANPIVREAPASLADPSWVDDDGETAERLIAESDAKILADWEEKLRLVEELNDQ